MRRIISVFLFGFITSANLISQVCLPNGIIFETQKTVDSFPAYYAGCRIIEGPLTIQGDDITHLDSLANIKTIKGDLIIQKTSQLISLHGLDGIDSLGGNLMIKENQGLMDLTALSRLTTIHGDLHISQNTQLESLSGLDSITLIVQGLIISSNPNLMSLDKFQQLDAVVGSVIIQSNSRLKHLYGLEGIMIHDGGIIIARNDSLLDYHGLDNLVIEYDKLFLEENPMAMDFKGFERLKKVGDMEIYGLPCRDFNGFDELAQISHGFTVARNSSLETFNGLPVLQVIQGVFDITRNDHLKNLHGLESINEIFAFRIEDNDSLISVEGINGLQSITTDLFISDNPNLVDLSAFNNTYGLAGRLKIEGNSNLQNLYGLDNLCETALFELIIEDNQNLSVCNTNCICAHLLQGGMNTIQGNKQGCNSSDEVIASCMVGSTSPNPTPQVQIIPNPANQFIDIKGMNQFPFEYTFLDVFGNRIQNEKSESSIINIQNLPIGMHVIVVEQNGSKFANRFVKL